MQSTAGSVSVIHSHHLKVKLGGFQVKTVPNPILHLSMQSYGFEKYIDIIKDTAARKLLTQMRLSALLLLLLLLMILLSVVVIVVVVVVVI